MTFPALQELESAHPFFRPFMNEIAKHQLSSSDFGLKLRLYFGAVLSVFDLLSDVYMTVVFLGSEETRGAAHLSIACCALSLVMQLWLVLFVNRKRKKRRILWEILYVREDASLLRLWINPWTCSSLGARFARRYVMTFIKPGVDVARVAAGNENDDGLASMDPLAELAYTRAIEMVFESIPAAIIQTKSLIVSKERSGLAVVSIAFSCFTTGFAAASMWSDWDTSPEKRRKNPKLAGATPDTGRGAFFFLLVMSGALQVAAKSTSSALLFAAHPNYFLAYMVGDHVLYQVYNVVRGDHRGFRAGVSVILSVVFQICEKVVADFTSCWMMRTPLSMHSAYFLFNQLAAHASLFVSVHVYVNSGRTHLSASTLWTSSCTLFAAWAVTYVARARATPRALT
jgi:hypothetical protein